MKYNLHSACSILERTPAVLHALLSGLEEKWTHQNEGPDTFSPYDVIGHLVHGEKTDWMPRTRHLLAHGTSIPFEPYDRFAQYRESEGKTLEDLLSEFDTLRKENIIALKGLALTEADLDKKGMHPSLGEVTLRHMLSTWVVHDLTHIAQVTRVMAKQYREEMGPWPAFFRILDF